MNLLFVKYKKLHPEAELLAPREGDVGFDIKATTVKRLGLFKVEYGTGIALDLPNTHWADLRPRSSVYKTGMWLANSCGVIDPSYKGELKFIYYRIPFISKFYKKGDKIGQLIFKQTIVPESLRQVTSLSNSERGDSGFGSTGK